jgi:hypothetical protein
VVNSERDKLIDQVRRQRAWTVAELFSQNVEAA